MHLYLVQHGTAVPKDENPDRPLSQSGRDDVSRIASFLGRSRLPVARVFHSGKLRAQETALLLSDVIGPGRVVEDCPCAINPNDSTDDLFTAIEAWPAGGVEGDVMIVGHLPFMSKLVSRLVAGDEDNVVVHFLPGTVVALDRGDNGGGWSVSWVVRPELLGG
jgi:phosphohistidine phosphatase